MSLEPTVQLARREHASDIAAMSRDYIEHGLDWRWTDGRVLRAIESPETNVAVVGEPGSLLAFGIMIYADDDAHLQLLAVRRAVQRQGIGSNVLIWLERVARDAGAARIGLEAREHNTVARSFYAAHNYHERAIEAEMYSGVESGVRFEKWLRARET